MVVPASVEDAKIADIWGMLDLSQATNLKKLELGIISQRATVIVPLDVEDTKTEDILGTLDLSQATNLRKLNIQHISPAATVIVPAGMEEVKILYKGIEGRLDLTKAVNLSEKVVAELEANVRDRGKVIRPIRINQ